MHEASLRILLVEDNEDDYIIVRDMLTIDMSHTSTSARFHLDWAATYEEGLAMLARADFDALLIDYNLSPHTGLEFMREAYISGNTAPMLLLTGQSDYELDVEAMRAGTADFLDKGSLNAALLERAIRYALEHKRIETTLQESEERFRTLTESMPQIVWMCRPDGWNIYHNQRWTDYTGLSLEESSGYGWNKPFHPDEKPLVRETWAYATAMGKPFETECRLRKADGDYRWFLIRGVPVRDQTDGIVHWLGTCTDIHDRKVAEESVRLSEAKLEEAQHVAGIGSWECDLATEKITWSKEMFSLHDLDEAQGEPDYTSCMALYHPDDAAHLKDCATRAVNEGIGYELDLRRATEDGVQPRWFHAIGRPIFNGDGTQVVRLFGTMLDITHRKLAEATLHDSEERLRLFVESVQDYALIMLDPQGVITRWNVGAEHIMGYKAEEAIGQHSSVFYTEEDNAIGKPAWTLEATRYQDRYEEDGFRVRKNGERFWVNAVTTQVLDAEGRLLGFSKVIRDISERKRIEEERDRFFTLSLDMLCIAGYDGYFKRLNPAFETTLGHSIAEMTTTPFLEFVHPDDRAATLAEMRKLTQGALTLQFVNRYRCNNGSYRWLSWRATPFEGLIYAAAHDITPLKDAEAVLQKVNEELEVRVMERTAELEISHREMSIAKQEAERANRAKSEFLSRMSHELRTPLNAILGFGQILDREDLSDLQKESIQYILKGGRHLLDLINEVLDIARVEAGHIELSLEPVALKDIVWEACALMQPLAAEQGIQLEIDVEEVDSIHSHVLADHQRLHQVLINLVANAIKYNRDGGYVSVSWCEAENERVRISVRDTGPGISEEDQSKLFTPFERLGAANSDIEGTGLGLVLAQRLVEVMGGTLAVESILGQGSTFFIELARTPSPEEMLKALPENTEANSPVQPGARIYTVLCIEDNLSNLRLMEIILEGRPDIVLLPAIQGGIGLDMAHQHEPDLILLDLNLPDISGKEVLARLQNSALTREIPVIIVSADATSSQMERLLANGAQAYLTKPLNVAEFLNTIDTILQKENEP